MTIQSVFISLKSVKKGFTLIELMIVIAIVAILHEKSGYFRVVTGFSTTSCRSGTVHLQHRQN